jgi:hypothetical protein
METERDIEEYPGGLEKAFLFCRKVEEMDEKETEIEERHNPEYLVI